MASQEEVLDMDPFKTVNLTINETIPEVNQSFGPFAIFMIILAFLRLAIDLVTVASSIVVIYAILRFKQLKNKFNSIILQYFVCTFLIFVFPTILILLREVILKRIDFRHTFCLAYGVDDASTLCIFLLVTLLSFEWYALEHQNAWIQKLQSKNVLIYAIYVIALLDFVVYMIFCYKKFYIAPWHLLAMFTFCFILASFINMPSFKRNLTKKESKHFYVIIVSSTLLLNYLPLCFINCVYDFNIIINVRLVVTLQLIFEIMAHGCPTLIVYLLGRYNKHFKMAFDKMFKRSIKNYDSDNIDASDDEDDNININKNTNISTNNVDVHVS